MTPGLRIALFSYDRSHASPLARPIDPSDTGLILFIYMQILASKNRLLNLRITQKQTTHFPLPLPKWQSLEKNESDVYAQYIKNTTCRSRPGGWRLIVLSIFIRDQQKANTNRRLRGSSIETTLNHTKNKC